MFISWTSPWESLNKWYGNHELAYAITCEGELCFSSVMNLTTNNRVGNCFCYVYKYLQVIYCKWSWWEIRSNIDICKYGIEQEQIKVQKNILYESAYNIIPKGEFSFLVRETRLWNTVGKLTWEYMDLLWEKKTIFFSILIYNLSCIIRCKNTCLILQLFNDFHRAWNWFKLYPWNKDEFCSFNQDSTVRWDFWNHPLWSLRFTFQVST